LQNAAQHVQRSRPICSYMEGNRCLMIATIVKVLLNGK
jgi:hypothetical protein